VLIAAAIVTRPRRSAVSLVFIAGIGSCAGPRAEDGAVASSQPAAREGGVAPTSASAAPPSVSAATTTTTPAPRPDAAAIFAQLKPAFSSCYEKERKSTPTMLDGKLTLNASFDAKGKAICAIPTEASGVTQGLEDCMSDRLEADTFGPGEPWTEVVPIAIHAGVLGLAERSSNLVALESVETRRMPDAFDLLESLVPKLQTCLHELDRSSGIRSIVVGAKVGSDGRSRCALASPSSGVLTPKVNACFIDTFAAVKFPPPKGGLGVILVPLNLVGR
jgi:hypothetical protein